jgi:hypothetical protein
MELLKCSTSQLHPQMNILPKASISSTIYKLVAGTAGVSIGIFLCEHLGRLYNYTRPSIYLWILANGSIKFFRNIGRMIAWLSSYLTWIKLDESLITARDLVIPTWNLVVSPFQIIYGYMIAAESYVDKEWLVYIGSGLFVLAIIATCYANRIKILNLPTIRKLRSIVDRLL